MFRPFYKVHRTAHSRPSLSTQPSQGLRLHREQSGTCPALKRLLRARLIGSSAFEGCRQRTCKLALGISSRRDQTLRTRLPAHKQRTNKLRCAPRRLKTVPVQGRRWRRRCCRHPCAPLNPSSSCPTRCLDLLHPAGCHSRRYTTPSATESTTTMGLVRQLIVSAIDAAQRPAADAPPPPADGHAKEAAVGTKDVAHGSEDSGYKQ